MPKIVQIGNRPQGSVGDVILSVSVGLIKAGHTVSNIFISGPVEPQAAARFPGEFISYANAAAKEGQPAVTRRLRHTLLQKRYDVVIAHRYHPCKITARASRGLALKRKIAVFHGLDNFKRLRRRIYARLFLRNWVIAGVSRAVAQDILQSGAGFRVDQVHTVSNGLDLKALETAQLTREAARERLGLPKDDLIFGHIGRLSDSKNQGVLIEAYARIAAQLPSSRLVIIGAGRMQNALRALVAKHGLQDRVLMPGFIPQAQLYLRAFDLFVFPSQSEAFGLALLEAMIARVPVIASNVGGIRELVGDYPFMIRPDDIQALALQMESMARKSEAERKQIANGLHARAAAGYDISHLEETYLNLIALPP